MNYYYFACNWLQMEKKEVKIIISHNKSKARIII